MPTASIFHDDSDESIIRVSELLAAGQIVAVPTETVYGLAANVLDETAIRKIFDIKGRPLIDPLIVHVQNPEKAGLLAEVSDVFLTLTEHFWPGPLTIIAEKREHIPSIVTAGLNTIALRSPAHPLLQGLLKHSGLSLAAPSANPFGYISPTTARHVADSLGARVEHILDGGPCKLGIESTIVDIRYPERPAILRLGPIDALQIEAVLKKHVTVNTQSSDKTESQVAPGNLSKHYSPHTKLQLFSQHDTGPESPANTAFIYINRPEQLSTPASHSYWFTESSDLNNAASALYQLLRRIDDMDYDLILVEKAPDHGIGIAINDRLQRAAVQ